MASLHPFQRLFCVDLSTRIGAIGLPRRLFRTVILTLLIFTAFFLFDHGITSPGNQMCQFCANAAMLVYSVVKKALPHTQAVLIVLEAIAVLSIASLFISEVFLRIYPPRDIAVDGLKHFDI
jgi:hypothetical protein